MSNACVLVSVLDTSTATTALRRGLVRPAVLCASSVTLTEVIALPNSCLFACISGYKWTVT